MKKNMKFEEAMSRLEEIVALLSDETTALDQALKLYGEASELSAFCAGKLEQAQLQMQMAAVRPAEAEAQQQITGKE